jgi:SAM-dependent methyltransferase
MTPDALGALFRTHSRLEGALAQNLETWIREPGTLERYLALVPKPVDGETRLLEVGCYQPTVGYYAALGWRDVIGIFLDAGEGTERGAYQTADQARVRFEMADIETARTSVADGWADAVLMMQVWEHFAIDPMQALWEINRVLKPGGRFVLSTPNGAGWQYALRIARGRAAWAGMEFTGFSHNRHNRLYDAEEMPSILADAGFGVTRCSSRDFGEASFTASERSFRAGLSAVDAALQLATGRRRERGTTLFVEARKIGPPRERFPASLYLTERDWPGITAERDRARRASEAAR